jgi:hypothetical protein
VALAHFMLLSLTKAAHGHVQRCVLGNPGPVEMTNLWRDEIPRFQERSAEPQIPSLGMTKGRATLPWKVVAG